jgi:hypothetical protein
MPRKRIDGVIEAVRYLQDGKIEFVRAYERRGAIWSDHILLQRAELVERLKKGRRFVTGQRKLYLGSSLETGKPVRYMRDRISTDDEANTRDLLTGTPVF